MGAWEGASVLEPPLDAMWWGLRVCAFGGSRHPSPKLAALWCWTHGVLPTLEIEIYSFLNKTAVFLVAVDCIFS